MSFSSIAAEQRKKEQKALGSFLAFSLIGSGALHIVVLTLSSLWVRMPEVAQEPIAQEPIGVMVFDTPSLQAAKPKEKTKSKGGAVAIGDSSRGYGTKSQGGSGAAGGSSIRGRSRVGGTAITPSTLSSKPTVATPSAKRDAIASIAPSQPTPVAKATTRVPVATLRPKPKLPPKPAQTRSPIATLRPKPESPPKPAATLPPEQASVPKPFSTSLPRPTATPEPKPSSDSTPVPVAPSPHNAKTSAPTQPLPARQQVQSDNPRGVGNALLGHAAASGNRETSGSTRGSGTRDSGQSTSPSNGLGSGSGTGSGNGSENGSKIATGPRNGNGNGLTTGSGSGTVTCRSCPIPEYPPGAEDLEGRAVVVIDVDRDGNVSNVQIAESTGHDILDQRVLETVKKKWKFTSSENGQRVRAAVDFAQQGSDFYSQAREREHQASELEQKKKRERQTH